MAVTVRFSTIPEMFRNLTDTYAGERRPVLMSKAEGSYTGMSYAALRRKADLFALGLASLGLRKGERVAIIAENRPEWVIADQGVVVLGGIDVPIYPTMTAKQIEYIFNDAGVRFAVVSNQFQLSKVARIFGQVQTLECVILMSEGGSVPQDGTMGFSQILEMGEAFEQHHPGYLSACAARVRPEDLLTLIYTSGTTGSPKGVMLTHENMCSNIIGAAEAIDFGPQDVLLSFLPLSHSFERMAGYYTAMACGATVAYAESVDTVRENMLEVRPTIITTVPRLFERIHSRIVKQVDAGSPIQRAVFRWAIGIGRKHASAMRRSNVPWPLRIRHSLADRLVFRKLRARTGGRMRFFVSGGAALGREFGEFFEAVGLTIIEGYGLTESSPVISVNRLGRHKFGTVGPPIPGVDVRIAEDGEILARGLNIMKGYWNSPESTAQAIDEGGWLHTGDIGHLDGDGFIRITDRKKHLFVSSGGKNIAPQPIENLFLSSKYIEQLMLIGDRRMYVTALIVPDFDALKEFAETRNIAYSNNTELTRHPEVNELFERDINAMQKDLANYERVRRFTLLDKQFTIEDGELTPTQKVRRSVVEQRYGHLIESMYQGLS